ncbi:MAG: hypothetical protein H6726_11165 [Sandaracinaceae bacterium]|nr:hypothetical protein [Myxococcales bacterium]MCB9658199.1 hypothetical protein [Sandaracinaceae bacterium]
MRWLSASRTLGRRLCGAALAGCVTIAGVAAGAAGCDETVPGETYVYVIDDMRILIDPEPADEGPGVIDGFDVDGVDGPVAEGNACRAVQQEDYTAPDGRHGIDNGLAGGGLVGLVTLLAAQEEDSADIFAGLVQSAVTGGTLLVLLEFQDVNSFENDDHVILRVALGEPFDVGVGTDGRLLSGQSFDLRDVEPVVIETSIEDGVLFASGISLQLEGSILDVEFELPISLGQLRVDFNPNGTITGVLGGALPWTTLADVIPRIGGASQFATLGRAILRGIADVMNVETGECDRISASIRVHGVPAFIYGDTAGTADAGVP